MKRMPTRARFAAGILFAVICAAAGEVLADGGRVIFTDQTGGYRITVFAEPVPLRPGPLDLSVFAQHRENLQPAGNVHVDFTLQPPDRSLPPHSAAASRQLATNRLFQAAKFELSTAGRWEVEMVVTDPSGSWRHTFPLTVAAPRGTLWDVAPWILLPFFPIVLFLGGEISRARREEKPHG